MKSALPEKHGLSEKTVQHLVFEEEGVPSLTNAQFAALEAGVGRGESMLVVSPTSTGKTQIALWAIARSLEFGFTTVYLVTHKALAKQKFEDFKSKLLPSYLDGDGSTLVIATGDYVEDAEGEIPKDPLRPPLLVATYEKFLAMLSSSGLPSDLGKTAIVCDEIQLLGDPTRGQSVEVLLTLLKNAGWGQLVGLSAVLQHDDARQLAEWLDVALVIEETREKHLRYECWTPTSFATSSTANPEFIEEGLPLPSGKENGVLSALRFLLTSEKSCTPIIVFCTKSKAETVDLAKKYLATIGKPKKGQLALAFDGLPATSANTFLSEILDARIGIHSTDLTEDERHVIEGLLLDGKLDVVFATSTLAAGVNFPLGAAIFASWERWDRERRVYIPIESDEFHNMAGRVGRMGFTHEEGKVIFFADRTSDFRNARRYLELGRLPSLLPRVTPERFNQLALQLVSSGLCASRNMIEQLVCNTFSALREADKNHKSFITWPQKLSKAINGLVSDGLLVETSSGKLTATPVGKAIGYSGLLPETGIFLLGYLVDKTHSLTACLPLSNSQGDMFKLSFLLFNACLSSPEYRSFDGHRTTRFLPYQLNSYPLFDADVYKQDLIEPVWQADKMPVNGSKLACDWIEGEEIRKLEGTFENLSAGVLIDMMGNLSWLLKGLSAIVSAASDSRVEELMRPSILRQDGVDLKSLSKLTRVIERMGFRVSEGLPDNVLWMMSLNQPGAQFRLTRYDIISLRALGFWSPERLMQGSPEASAAREAAFAKVKPSPQAKANWLREACRGWKSQQRQRMAERHSRRTRLCMMANIVERYYVSKGNEFEDVFEEILNYLGIAFEKLDDSAKTGAPDYLVKLQDSPPLIFELKTRNGDKLVDYNKAVEVLAASEVHGHGDTFCVTLCHPGVDPSVPTAIAQCDRLSVVESCDLGEALLRVCENTLSQAQLWKWLATPGQALAGELPFREFR